jgi:hypothetical protein
VIEQRDVTECQLGSGNGVKRHGELEKTAMSRNCSLYRARGLVPVSLKT